MRAWSRSGLYRIRVARTKLTKVMTDRLHSKDLKKAIEEVMLLPALPRSTFRSLSRRRKKLIYGNWTNGLSVHKTRCVELVSWPRFDSIRCCSAQSCSCGLVRKCSSGIARKARWPLLAFDNLSNLNVVCAVVGTAEAQVYAQVLEIHDLKTMLKFGYKVTPLVA